MRGIVSSTRALRHLIIDSICFQLKENDLHPETDSTNNCQKGSLSNPPKKINYDIKYGESGDNNTIAIFYYTL